MGIAWSRGGTDWREEGEEEFNRKGLKLKCKSVSSFVLFVFLVVPDSLKSTARGLLVVCGSSELHTRRDSHAPCVAFPKTIWLNSVDDL